MRARLKGVHKVKKPLADGSTRIFYYHRATRARLPDDPRSAEFARAVDEENAKAKGLLRVDPPEPQRNLSWLIRKYEQSADWTERLSESTRKIERLNLKAIEAAFGDMPLAAIEERGARADFLEWRDEIARTYPRAADAKLTRLARVLAFGLDRDHIGVNPIATFKRVYESDRSEIIWLPEHIQAFEAAAPPDLQLALVLALHTGQRQGDLLSLAWTNYDGRAITLVQGKTKTKVYVPCTKALKATLDALPRRSLTVLLNADGEPWTRDSFKKAWARAFEASGLTNDLHFHDLRGTAVTMLSEAGATPQEIATITGHKLTSVNKILEVYLARTRTLAESAIAKLDDYRAARQASRTAELETRV